MQKITPFLFYESGAEEAAQWYVSLFPNSKILEISRCHEGEMGPAGSVRTVTFQVGGQKFWAGNGGPYFKFSDGISLFVLCENQEEIDHYWEKLSQGGEKRVCGWLKDRFGVSWQIVPTCFESMMCHADQEKSRRVMAAMMNMAKFDIAGLEKAFQGPG
ncbi:MAG: VOC family protein [Gemmataceae bacterium]|nr:VOC family protein [Gemmataceae bacterium]